MVAFEEILVVVAFFWILLIAVANRVDLTKYHLYVSSGFLLYTPPFFTNATNRLAGFRKFWKSFGIYSLFPTLLLFLAVPLILTINLIQGIFFSVSPIFIMDIVTILRVEAFILMLPPLALFLTIQFVISAIYNVMDGKEIDKSGILVVGFILSIFSTTKGESTKKFRLQSISTIIIINLIIVLISMPLGLGLQSVTQTVYEESDGAIIVFILPNTPGSNSQLENGDVIKNVIVFSGNFGQERVNVTSATLFKQIVSQIPPPEEFILVTMDGTQIIISGVNPPKDVAQATGSYLGLEIRDYRPAKWQWVPPLLPFWIGIFFDWMLNLGLLFTVYSLLPIPGTAGSQLLSEMITKFELDISLKGKQIISFVSLLILMGNIVFFIL